MAELFANPYFIASVVGIKTAADITGQISAGNAAKAAGQAQQQSAEYTANFMKQQAGQEQAAAQRRASEERRRATLVASRGQAVAAASGAGALDPTVVDTLSDVAGEGELRALTAIYQGNERATSLTTGANNRLYEGDMALAVGNSRQSASRLAAVGSAFNGASKVATMKWPSGGGGTMGNDYQSMFELSSPDSLYQKYG